MKKFTLFIWMLGSASHLIAQQVSIRGTVKDVSTAAPLPQVEVRILTTPLQTTTDETGSFTLSPELAPGSYQLELRKSGYLELHLPITITPNTPIVFDFIPMEIDLAEANENLTRISLSDVQLNSDDALQDNVISGLLGATNDVFSNAAAFDFSATFFRPRGLDSKYSRVLINGITLNKLNSGRPQWSNWGGLNDAMRNREFSMGFTPSAYSFGAPAGALHFNMRATAYRPGGRISYATANRTYTGRVMGSYNTGMTKSNWAFAVLASRRFGQEGAIAGTFYDANSLFIAAEKLLSETHSINLALLYTPNRRGRSTALTQEVIDLKGADYNPNWGYQNDTPRNARNREIEEPLAIVSHYWKWNDHSSLNTNLAYQWGTTKNSRIDYTGNTLVINPNGQESFIGGARNPAPNYYQKLPSYFLRFENPTAAQYQQAYLAEQAFMEDGQLDWQALYRANQTATASGLNSIYAVQNDVTKDHLFKASSLLKSRWSENYDFHAGVSFTHLNSENYAALDDLLGGTAWLDIDSFAEDDNTTGGDLAQSDLQHRNRLVGIGDTYKYRYSIVTREASAFAQLEATHKHLDWYLGLQIQNTTHRREGYYENGYYPGDASLGRSAPVHFTTYGAKAGLTYKLNSKHFLQVNSAVLTQPLPTQTVFTNARQNNASIASPEAERILNLDASYIFRGNAFKARLTGYYLNFSNGSEVSYFYTQSMQTSLIDQGNALVQEITTGIGRQNLGIELGASYQVHPTLTFKAAAAVGQYQYTSDPQVYYTTTLAPEPIRFGDGAVQLTNYRVAGGPEQAHQLGFDYRDPDFWWLGASVNRFSNAYVDVSYLRRSGAFAKAGDGQPLTTYNTDTARELLQQEQLPSYYLVNLVGGKSWRVKQYTFGFFGLINNALNTRYKTGGFEDSRIGDYQKLTEERSRQTPLFGNRYFLGYGTTFYLNCYVRF